MEIVMVILQGARVQQIVSCAFEEKDTKWNELVINQGFGQRIEMWGAFNGEGMVRLRVED